MILADGKLYGSGEQEALLERMAWQIQETRGKTKLKSETVIRAVRELVDKFQNGLPEDKIRMFNLQETAWLDRQLAQMLTLLQQENLEYKLKTELSSPLWQEQITKAGTGGKRLCVKAVPLGTLFHIAAGNMDGLPVYSVLEGLLTGNVNILKLPQADNGLSIALLQELIGAEPGLAPYIYVFDTPSEDIGAMKKMADLSDGIVVWGGDEAVRAVRRMARPGTRLIEWGHKLGFVYISGYEDKERELPALAEHIISTKQLLCSSCQVIYLDTEKEQELHEFCKEFLPLLEREAAKSSQDIGAVAQRTLKRYSREIEEVLNKDNLNMPDTSGTKTYYGKGCSLTVMPDSELELSDMYGNCLVKCLPHTKMMEVLRRQKNYLQTAGLICLPKKREELTQILCACGLTRIMRAGSQSDTFVGEAHDGEYALQRYVRILNVEL